MDKLVSSTKGQSATDKVRTSEHAVDGDAFTKILDDKVNGSGKDHKKEQEMFTGKEAGKNSTQEAKEREEQFKKTMGIKIEQLVGNKNFIYNLAMKDPAQLSTAERQSFRLGEFSASHLALEDFKKALADRGLELKDLSCAQTSKLSKCKTKEELTEKLDDMDVKPQAQADGSQASHTSRPSNSPMAAAQASDKTSPLGKVDGAKTNEARRSQHAADVRKQQREEVIRQVMVHIDVQNVANKTEVALRLNPEYLGDMKIKLRFEGRSGVSADFETTNAETKALLDEDMDSLKTAFDNKGMTLLHGRTHLVETVS